jgi:diphthamide biosynthesis protein 3
VFRGVGYVKAVNEGAGVTCMRRAKAVLSGRECCGKTLPPPHARQTFFLSSRTQLQHTMADEELNLYDEIEIEDCFYDATLQIYHHPCPCGDRFEISIADMRDGEDIARCPSCSLMIRIIFDEVC